MTQLHALLTKQICMLYLGLCDFMGATCEARDAYYFYGTPGLTLFRKGPLCLKKFINIYASPGL